LPVDLQGSELGYRVICRTWSNRGCSRIRSEL
jgi:hypothetical protein